MRSLEEKLAGSRSKALDKRIEKTNEFLHKISIKAPTTGYLRYLNSNAAVAPGSQFHKGYRFAEIPDLNSMVFEVFIPHENRKFFKPKRSATIPSIGE